MFLTIYHLQILKKSLQPDLKIRLSILIPLSPPSPLNTFSTDAAKPTVTEENESTTTSTVSTSAPSSSAEQVLSTAESTLGKQTTETLLISH